MMEDRPNYSIVQFNRMVRIGSKNLLLAVAYHHYNAKKGTPEGSHWREIIKLNGGKVKGKPEPVAMPLPVKIPLPDTIPPTPREQNMDDIDVIARRRKLHRDDILGPSRYKQVVDARHECIALFRSRGLSTPAIGRIMQRDHTSIVHALQQMKKKAVAA
jgi:hypothetical protein